MKDRSGSEVRKRKEGGEGRCRVHQSKRRKNYRRLTTAMIERWFELGPSIGAITGTGGKTKTVYDRKKEKEVRSKSAPWWGSPKTEDEGRQIFYRGHEEGDAPRNHRPNPSANVFTDRAA